MAQAGYTPISLYYSTTAAAVPTSGNLASGELAINITDGKLYYKNNSGVVTLLAGATAGPAGGSNTQVQYNNSGVLAGSANFTFDGTNIGLAGGTANGVAYLNGSKVLTSGSALTFDGTNFVNGSGGVRAGTNSGSGGALSAWGGASGATIDITPSTVSGANGVTYNTSFISGGSGPHIFSIGGSEGMRLTSTGLGIGTSSPAAKLQVVSTGAASIIGSSGASNVYSQWNYNASAIGYLGNGAAIVSAGAATDFALGATNKLWMVSGAGSQYAVLDTSGNLGLGVTPSAWFTSYGTKVFQFAASGSLYGLDVSSSDRRVVLQNNAYIIAAGGENYLNTGAATKYLQTASQHQWFNAPSGTAGNAITFTQAMTLDASGNLGIGTTSPSSFGKLAVNGNIVTTTDNVFIGVNDGSDNKLSLVKKAGGFPCIASASSAPIIFSQSSAASIVSASAETYTERARIDSSGNLLVKLTSAIGSETVQTSGSGTTNKYCYFAAADVSTYTGYAMRVYSTTNSAVVGSITFSTTNTAYNTSSDYRLKNITGALTGYKERLMSLQPKQGTWIVDGSEFRGFLAHEFANPYRASVTGEKDAVDAEGKPVMQAMQASSSEVMADLVAMVKDLITENASLKARLDAANL